MRAGSGQGSSGPHLSTPYAEADAPMPAGYAGLAAATATGAGATYAAGAGAT